MKCCSKCKLDKQVRDFYCTPPSRGSRPAQPCKDCKNARVRHRRNSNPSVREYDRVRNKQPARRVVAARLAQKWDRSNPDGYAAHYTLTNAIRAGKIKRGPCIDCGSTEHVYGIHADYSKPLEVFWRCALCHRRITAAKGIPNWRKRFPDKPTALDAVRRFTLTKVDARVGA